MTNAHLTNTEAVIEIANSKNLTHLDLSDNNKLDFELFFQELKENYILKDLNLSCNPLEKIDFTNLCIFVRENYELLHLDLSHCEI